MYFSQFRKLGSQRSRHWQPQVAGEKVFLRGPLFAVPSRHGRARAPSGLLWKGTNPTQEGSTLMISASPEGPTS